MRYMLGCAALLWTMCLSAHPKKMTNIVGQGVELKTINHSFSGRIKNRLVTGFKKKGLFESELSIIEDDHKTTAVFKRQSHRLGQFGGIVSFGRGVNIRQHDVEFVSFDPERDVFVFRFDNEDREIQVLADRFEDGHYVNPEYRMTVDQKVLSFKVQDGQACRGYSMHLIAMVFSLLLF